MSEDKTVVDSAETTTNELPDSSQSYEETNGEGESDVETESESSKSDTTETSDQRLSRLKRMYERELKKQGFEDEKSNESRQEDGQESSKEKEEVDDRYERLELKVEGISSKKQQDIVIEYAAFKGVDVTSALKSPVVKAMLAEEKKKVSSPSPSKRTSAGKTDSFEYHVAQARKGIFPTNDPKMMARLKKARIFTK